MPLSHPVTGPALCVGSTRAATDVRTWVEPMTHREVKRGRCRHCRRDVVVDRTGHTYRHFPTPRPARTRPRAEP